MDELRTKRRTSHELQAELAKANAELEQRRKVMADIVRELGHGLAGLAHHEIQPAIASLRERNHELNERLAVADFELQQANAELERLRWRPVSVKPTREDADASGNVEVITPKGRILLRMFSSWPWELNHTTAHEVSHWRPFCPPPALTAEEVERERFEAAYLENYPAGMPDLQLSEDGEYRTPSVRCGFKMWQAARAAKEVEK